MVRWGTIKSALGLALVAAAMSWTPVAAQQDVRVRTECRCVDRDGNEIERCSCFGAPDFQGLAGAIAGAENRARFGISVDGRQSARNDARGARITDVMEDGPADRAGLEVGDIVTRIGDQSLFDAMSGDAEAAFDLDDSIPVQRLLAIIRDVEPGEEVEVAYLRDGEERSATLEAEDLSERWGMASSQGGSWFNRVLGGRNEDGQNAFEFRFDRDGFEEEIRALEEQLAEGRNSFRFRGGDEELRFFGDDGELRVFGGDGDVHILREGGAGTFRVRPGAPDAPEAPRVVRGRSAWSFFGDALGGVELLELNPELGEYFGTEIGTLVTEVDDESALGVEAGDVILRIGDRNADSPDRVRRILSSYAEDEEITFHVMRDGREIAVQGRLGS